MSAALDEALTAAAKRLHVSPRIDRVAREALLTVITTAYDYRPAAMRDLTREEHRTGLSDSALTEMYAHCVLTLSGQYGRASAHLLHTLDRWAPAAATH
ncbi:hypothetical protein OG196_14050 [Kitasatospora purpeofusca]|uniref:hypothetical protein n=1 Tax=Kitasatospora purpeofusca TaxID=67352 RepID=UPI002E0D450B|nr:hypothetical protein OG196_14050 [Kitasatospora purpeofusca]